MRRTNILIVLAVVVSFGCGKQRLDSFLFNPDTDITQYLLDDYEGDTEIDLPSSYDIDDYYLFSIQQNSSLAPRVHMVYLGDTARIGIDTVILYCHGNAAHMDAYWPRAKLLANTGGKQRFGVLMLDYPGYGLSEGEPTEEGMYESVDLAMRWLQSRGMTGDRLAIYGFSLGSAPATELTAQPRTLQPSWLMLEAPFASADVLVQDPSVFAFPASYFTNLSIDNAEEIKAVEEPFFWIHGQNDLFLSIETHGEVVFANYAGAAATAVRVPGGDHSDVPQVMGFEAYIQAIESFLTD